MAPSVSATPVTWATHATRRTWRVVKRRAVATDTVATQHRHQAQIPVSVTRPMSGSRATCSRWMHRCGCARKTAPLTRPPARACATPGSPASNVNDSPQPWAVTPPVCPVRRRAPLDTRDRCAMFPCAVHTARGTTPLPHATAPACGVSTHRAPFRRAANTDAGQVAHRWTPIDASATTDMHSLRSRDMHARPFTQPSLHKQLTWEHLRPHPSHTNYNERLCTARVSFYQWCSLQQ
jgi:hypothetical protein